MIGIDKGSADRSHRRSPAAMAGAAANPVADGSNRSKGPPINRTCAEPFKGCQVVADRVTLVLCQKPYPGCSPSDLCIEPRQSWLGLTPPRLQSVTVAPDDGLLQSIEAV